MKPNSSRKDPRAPQFGVQALACPADNLQAAKTAKSPQLSMTDAVVSLSPGERAGVRADVSSHLIISGGCL
jgi:hypothetical protein